MKLVVPFRVAWKIGLLALELQSSSINAVAYTATDAQSMSDGYLALLAVEDDLKAGKELKPALRKTGRSTACSGPVR